MDIANKYPHCVLLNLEEKNCKSSFFFVKNVVKLHTSPHLQPRPLYYFHNFLTRRCRFEFELNLPPSLEGKPIYHIIHPFDSSHWTKYEKKIFQSILCLQAKINNF